MQGENGHSGVRTVGGREVADLAVEDHSVAAIPVLYELEPAVDLPPEFVAGTGSPACSAPARRRTTPIRPRLTHRRQPMAHEY